MPRVAFHLLNLRIGGQTESVLALHSVLARHGIQSLLPLHKRTNLKRKSEIQKYLDHFNPLSRMGHFLLGLRHADPADIQHIILPSPGWAWLVWLAMGLLRGRRMIVQFGGYSSGFHEPYRRILGWMRHAPGYFLARLAVNSFAVARCIPRDRVNFLVATRMQVEELARLGVKQSRIRVMPNLTDGLARMPRAAARARLGLPAEDFLFGFAGRPSPVKGVDLLLEAYRMLITQERARGSRLVLAGIEESPDTEAMNSEHVSTFGVVDMAVFLSAIDVLVLPYRTLLTTNLQPSLVLEALSLGTPILTTDVRPLDELADTGIRLRLCAAGDSRMLGERMAEFRQDVEKTLSESRHNMRIFHTRYLLRAAETSVRCYQQLFHEPP